MTNPLQSRSIEPKAQGIQPEPSGASKMTDEELDRILSETLGDLDIGTESDLLAENKKTDPVRDPSSIPLPEESSISEKEMMKQQMMMMMRPMIEEFTKSPNKLREMLQMQMGLMMQPQKMEAVSEIPLNIGELSRKKDHRMAMIALEKLATLGPEFKKGRLSSARLEELIANGTLTIVSKAEVEARGLAIQQELMALSEFSLGSGEQLAFSQTLEVFGVEEKYRPLLSRKTDIVVELELARFNLLSIHSDLLEVFIDFELNMGGEMGEMNPLPGMGQDIASDSLRKLCKDDQFARISQGMTRYLVTHYKLGND